MMFGIIKVDVSVISQSRSQRLRLMTLTETLIFMDTTKCESNKIATNLFLRRTESEILLETLAKRLKIMHCVRNRGVDCNV